jgi:hypothetical protein
MPKREFQKKVGGPLLLFRQLAAFKGLPSNRGTAMRWSQWKNLTAMLLIGDGVLAILRPYRNARTWDVGPDSWKALMQYLSDHPDLLRAIGVAEVAVGMALIASDGTARERMEEEAAAMRARIRSIA